MSLSESSPLLRICSYKTRLRAFAISQTCDFEEETHICRGTSEYFGEGKRVGVASSRL